MSRPLPFQLAALACLGLVLCLTLSACQNKAKTENFGKVEFQMTEAKVTELLGEPSECTESGGMKRCVWKHSTGEFHVSFQGGKVVQKGGKSTTPR